MPVVRSHFINLSLIVNRPLGASVIWPIDGHHNLEITGPNNQVVVPAPGAHIHYTVNGVNQLSLGRTTPPTRSLVPHLDDIAGIAVSLTGSPLTADPAPGIRGICHLTGGGFQAPLSTAHNGIFRNYVWSFQRPNNTIWAQQMTNSVIHEFDVPLGSTLSLGSQSWVVNADVTITFEQRENCPLPQQAQVYRLDELPALYALVNPQPLVPTSNDQTATPHLLALGNLQASSPITAPAVFFGCDPVCGVLQIDHTS